MPRLTSIETSLFDEALKAPNPLSSLTEAVRHVLRMSKNDRQAVLSKLEEYRTQLQKQSRDSDEDIVLEVMDFLVGWASPHSRIAGEPNGNDKPTGASGPNAESEGVLPKPHFKVVFPGTSGGVWTDRHQAAIFRDLYFPPTVAERQTITVLDLTGIVPTPGVLQDLLLPLAQRIKGGVYGDVTLVVRTHDQGVADFIGYLAKEHELSIFISGFHSDFHDAQPAGNLTSTEVTTLNILNNIVGGTTVAQFAQSIGIEPNAAGNRLVNLAKKGFVYRVPQPRHEGDIYIDRRTVLEEISS